MKNEFKKDIKIVIETINKYDPMNILTSGAPEDEYSSEAIEILSAYYRHNNLDDLKKSIREIFVKSFGIDPKLNLSYFDKMTMEIFVKVSKS